MINKIKNHWIECQGKRQLDHWRLQALRLKDPEYAQRAKTYDKIKNRFRAVSLACHILAWGALCFAFTILQKMELGKSFDLAYSGVLFFAGALNMLIWTKVESKETDVFQVAGAMIAGLGFSGFGLLASKPQMSMVMGCLTILPISILCWGSIIHGAIWWKLKGKGYLWLDAQRKRSTEKEFLMRTGRWKNHNIELRDECDHMAVALLEQDELKKLTKLHKVTHTQTPKRL